MGRRIVVVALIMLSLGIGCAHRREPTSSDLVRYGVDLARDGFWHEAAVHWKMVLEKDPDNVAALNNIAIAAEVENKPEEARRLLKKALSKRPGSTQIQRNLKTLLKRAEEEKTRDTSDEEEEADR